MATVNLDDAILTSKIYFQDTAAVLVLTPERLICRQFASSNEIFSLPLNNMLGAQLHSSDPKTFLIAGLLRHPSGARVLAEQQLTISCSNVDEALEWVETLNSIDTDRSIRAIQAQEKAKEEDAIRQAEEASQYAAATAELKQMFPNVEDDVLLEIVQNNRGNTEACIEPLLALSDPNYALPAGVGTNTSTPADQILQDQLLAQMLQDEMFLAELQRNQEFQGSLPSATRSSNEPEPSIADRFQKLTDATKKSLVDWYRRITTTNNTPKDESEKGQEMVSMTVRPTQDELDNEEEQEDENASLLSSYRKPSRKEPVFSAKWQEENEDEDGYNLDASRRTRPPTNATTTTKSTTTLPDDKNLFNLPQSEEDSFL